MTTKIVDVIEPTTFTNYTIQRTMELSNLISSGIAQNTAEFDALASGSSTLINMPYWQDLTGDAEVMNDTDDTVPGKIEAGSDIARRLAFTKSFGANALAGHLAGDDPMRAIADLFADYWARWNQKLLLAELDGIFAADSMKNKTHDITGLTDDAAKLSGNSFLDATQLMGDAKESLTGIMMHSAAETYLRKLDLLKPTGRYSAMGQPIFDFFGKTVIVDDSIAYDTETGASEMYLFGNGAIAWGNGNDPLIKATEVYRDSMKLAGEDVLINRRLSILHPRGVKWTEKSVTGKFPTLEELQNGTNWEKVYDDKAIRIVKFVFKL